MLSGWSGSSSQAGSYSAIALATSYVAGFGSLAVAGFGIAARLEYILVPISFGIGSALTAMVATNLGASTPSILTIHNLAFPGYFPMSVFGELGLPPQALSIDGVDHAVKDADGIIVPQGARHNVKATGESIVGAAADGPPWLGLLVAFDAIFHNLTGQLRPHVAAGIC